MTLPTFPMKSEAEQRLPTRRAACSRRSTVGPGLSSGPGLKNSLTIGATMRGGHTALVVEATLADGAPSVLKIGVPGYRRQLGFEATVLDLAAGKSCARLTPPRPHPARTALLLERLGPTMYEVILDPRLQHDMLCDTVALLWRRRSTTGRRLADRRRLSTSDAAPYTAALEVRTRGSPAGSTTMYDALRRMCRSPRARLPPSNVGARAWRRSSKLERTSRQKVAPSS